MDGAAHGHEPDMTRRKTLRIGAATIGSYLIGSGSDAHAELSQALIRGAIEQVVPTAGVRLRFSFGDAIQRLIAAGALDPGKYLALYDSTGDVPEWVRQLLAAPSNEPILLNRENAMYLLNLLWPLGLANRLDINRNSPINTLRLPSFASTGGWTLGRDKDGYVYFNRVDALALTARQEAQVREVATRTFRPCCDNATFFQDCNHGSALFGLITLAASQDASAAELYRLALAANAYWFPDRYVLTAVYFLHLRAQAWTEIAPPLLLGDTFSSLSGWEQNVGQPLKKAQIKLPADVARQLACGI